jgi:hypothetical protein
MDQLLGEGRGVRGAEMQRGLPRAFGEPHVEIRAARARAALEAAAGHTGESESRSQGGVSGADRVIHAQSRFERQRLERLVF